jgi:amino acid adenylation domain-containing protein
MAARVNSPSACVPKTLRGRVRIKAPKSFHPFPREALEQSIADRFETQARQFSDHIAVESYNTSISYDELNRAANRVAHAILLRQARTTKPAVLLFKQGTAMITASMGALKAGTPYASLDFTLPLAKARQMVRHLQASLLLTDNAHFALAQSWIGDPAKIINLDELSASLSERNPALKISPDDLASINYTSGSTGEPKGVMWNQRGELYSTMARVNALKISSEDRISLLRSNNVGATRETFLALLSGATVVALELRQEGFGDLAQWLDENRITVFTCVASVFRHAVKNSRREEKFPSIRLVHLGGEPLARSDIEYFKKSFSDSCIFVSRFGMSETPTLCYNFIDKRGKFEGDKVPLGFPLEGNDILLLDDDGNDVGIGAIGEITVRSFYLAEGYWRNERLSGEKFCSDPRNSKKRVYRTGDLAYRLADGCLVHAGRKDFQTKIRGHRVEISEVEIALLRYKGVKQAAVVARTDEERGTRLIAYAAAQKGRKLTARELREFLIAHLPGQMVPSVFVVLNSLPLTASGKIDRRALPFPENGRTQLENVYVEPLGPLERVLANVWAEVFGVANIGVQDDFSELGGDSLLGARIVAWVNDKFALLNPLKTLFETPTVARLADYLVAEEAAPGQVKRIAEILVKVEAMSSDEVRSALEAK